MPNESIFRPITHLFHVKPLQKLHNSFVRTENAVVIILGKQGVKYDENWNAVN